MSALDGWIDICRAGTWRDMAGRAVPLDADRLDRIVAAHAAADAAGEVKNLAAVDFAPTGLVENATHFAIMDAAAAGSVRAWGRLVDENGADATVSQASEDDILRVPAGAVVVRIPSGA